MGASRDIGNIGDTLTEFGRLPLNLVATGTATANNYLCGDGTWKAVALTNIDANNITIGTLNSARLGNIDANNITIGTLNSARLGNIDANNISSGILNKERLASGVSNNSSYLRGDGTWQTINNFAQLTNSQTFSAKQIFSTDTSIGAKISNLAETANVVISVAPATVNYDILTQSVLYYTANSTSNVTVNLRGSSTKTLDSIVANGECITAVFVMTNGLTAYTANTIQIDGISVTPKWQGGTRAIGNANSADSYIFSTVKTSNNSYIVLASLTKYS